MLHRPAFLALRRLRSEECLDQLVQVTTELLQWRPSSCGSEFVMSLQECPLPRELLTSAMGRCLSRLDQDQREGLGQDMGPLEACLRLQVSR
jgi:hypothetical protein